MQSCASSPVKSIGRRSARPLGGVSGSNSPPAAGPAAWPSSIAKSLIPDPPGADRDVNETTHNKGHGRARLFGFEVDRMRMAEAVDQLLKWAEVRDSVCRYVVTPNADHAVVYQENEDLRRAYAGASLILVDGMPLLVAAKL